MDPLEKNARYDRETVEVMRRVVRRRDRLIDVGCHRGSVLRHMLAAGQDNEIHAFEPVPFLYRELLETFGSLPNVKLHRLALSDRQGEASFQLVRTNPGYSGFRRRTYPRPDEIIDTIQVPVSRLDDVVKPDPDRPLRFLKIDVEGAELAVMQGAIRTLTREQPYIVFEHGLGAADHYGVDPEQVYDLLAGACGLRISTMRDWLRDEPPLARARFARMFREGREFYYLAHP